LADFDYLLKGVVRMIAVPSLAENYNAKNNQQNWAVNKFKLDKAAHDAPY
jgi:hypothetical protein